MKKRIVPFLVCVLLVACNQASPPLPASSGTSTPITPIARTVVTETGQVSPTVTVTHLPDPPLRSRAGPTAEVAAASLPPLSVTDFPDTQSIAMAMTTEGTLYVALGQADSILVARSSDGGHTFHPPVQANLDAPASTMALERPALAANAAGRVGVAWLQSLNTGKGIIWYALSEDHGETFGASQRVSVSERLYPTLLDMTVDEAFRPVITWLEQHGALYLARSSDRDQSFSTPRKVIAPVCDCCRPRPLVVGGQIIIAFRNLERGTDGQDIRDIYVTRPDTAGEDFEALTRVSDAPWYFPACPISGPSAAANNEHLYVGWMDGRHDVNRKLERTDIWVAASTDGGRTFSPNVRLNPVRAGEFYNNLPTLAVGPEGRLHVVWESDEDARQVLYYAFSDDGGQTFTVPTVVVSSDDGTGRGKPHSAMLLIDEDGRLHLAWVDGLGAHIANAVEQ